MSRLFYHTMQDNLGNLLFDVTGTMRIAGSGTLATIYGDEAMTVILPNPMTNHPSYGSFKCYLDAGSYDFYMAKGGYTFETLTGLQGWGTMALQDADAVAITGGSATLTAGSLTGMLAVSTAAPGDISSGRNLSALGQLLVSGTSQLADAVGVGMAPVGNVAISVAHAHSAKYGMTFRPTDTDTGTAVPVMSFNNLAGTPVGTITTNATATAYNTSSDARLKHDVETLTGELDILKALRPVGFRWNADDSRGYGFIASEVQQALPDANVITGLPDAVDEAGGMVPQMIDYSKLVPFLVGAIKTLAAQVESLTARA